MPFFSTLFALLNPYSWTVRAAAAAAAATPPPPPPPAPLGRGAGTKRRREVPNPSHERNVRRRLEREAEDENKMQRYRDSRRSYTREDCSSDEVLSESSEALEFEHSDWIPARDLISSKDDETEADRLQNDRQYAQFMKRRDRELTPFRDLPETWPADNKDSRAQLKYQKLINARNQTLNLPEHDARIWTMLDLRGHDPVLPMSMWPDLQGFRQQVFTHDPNSFLRPLGLDNEPGTTARAARALEYLTKLGPYVRDLDRTALPGGKCPEDHIKYAVEQYFRWSINDAGLDPEADNFDPVLVIHACPLQATRKEMEPDFDELVQAMLIARAGWADDMPVGQGYTLNPPPIFGILCAGPAVCLVSLQDLEDEPEFDEDGREVTPPPFNLASRMRMLSFYRFDKDKIEDFWKSMGIAEFIIYARNILMEWQAKNKEVGGEVATWAWADETSSDEEPSD